MITVKTNVKTPVIKNKSKIQGEGKVGALCRRSRCCKDGNGSEVHDESRGEWERERKESFSRVGVCTYVRNGLCDNNNFFNIGSTAMLFTFGIWL